MPPSHAPAADQRDTALLEIEQQLGLLWRRGRAASQAMARALHPELDPAGYGLLAILHREGPMRVTDLAAAVGVGKPTVSRQVTLLEELGLVRKESDPEDRRAALVLLSEEGRAHVDDVLDRRRGFFREALGAWDESEVAALAGYLRRLNTTLAEKHAEHRHA
ncbi:MarR family transcriptional regulator [Sinomonas halotolerans]|uniref:MarR family transcriptional regulator n=1 Tax=Sinomonas halotolerans TaxID=1644133 RepID=A0ABU9WVH5_9MICC